MKKPRRYCGFELMTRANKEFEEAKDDYNKMSKWVDRWNVIWVEEVNKK